MSKRIQELEGMIERLEDQAKKKKAELKSKKQAELNKQRTLDRKARNRHIYKLGGMVEKMGLDQIDDILLLGLLEMINKHYCKSDIHQINNIIHRGKPYLEAGEQLEPPQPLARHADIKATIGELTRSER